LDDAVEKHDIEKVLSYFSDDCEIEIFGITLRGKDRLKKALERLYKTLGKITFKPLVIMVDGDTFFEEFFVQSNKRVRSLQSRLQRF
jgi:ketosteroid isomerase-like protein